VDTGAGSLAADVLDHGVFLLVTLVVSGQITLRRIAGGRNVPAVLGQHLSAA
jgi:hypothetical protein